METDGVVTRDMTRACPTCGQKVETRRHVVRWPPIKQEIFITIASRGDIGASTDEILNEVYAGRRRVLPSCIRSHIWQMNDVLETEASMLRIICDGGRWQLVRGPSRR